jgi:hypothetical protein
MRREQQQFYEAAQRTVIQSYYVGLVRGIIVGVIATLAVTYLLGCGDNMAPPPVLTFVDPDAGIDAPPPDACVYVHPDAAECCDLLPDEDAVRTCVNLPPGACGVIVCRHPDCSAITLNVCGPIVDGGV